MDETGPDPQEGFRSRGSDAVGDLTNALLDNPLFKQALSSALGMGEKATQAQRRAMDAVGLPSSDDLGRLERRIRSLSDRLESLEDLRAGDETPHSSAARLAFRRVYSTRRRMKHFR